MFSNFGLIGIFGSRTSEAETVDSSAGASPEKHNSCVCSGLDRHAMYQLLYWQSQSSLWIRCLYWFTTLMLSLQRGRMHRRQGSMML